MIAILAPALLVVLLDEQLSASGASYFWMSISGLTAYAIVALQFVLQSGNSWVKKSIGSKQTLQLHRAMAIVLVVLAIIHLALLLWIRGNWNLVLVPRVNWPVFLGRVCLVTMILILVYSIFRKRIPINNADWRWFHNALAWTILLSGFLHGLTIGSSFENDATVFIWIAYFAIAILSWVRARRRLE